MSKMLSKHESKCKCVECAAIKPDQIMRYLDLVDRRLEILVHSGVDWQPEYEDVLAAIDKELAELRQLVDREHQRRDQMPDQDTPDIPDSQEPQTLQLQTQYCVYDDVLLQVSRYQANNSLCIQAYNHTDGPIARLTVCLADTILGDNCAFVDVNNCPWAEDFIRRYHLGTDMGVMASSGYCVYPLYKFDMVELNKYV